MANTANLTSDWARRLGLLPVPLFTEDPISRSVLLNGSVGNFCLDTRKKIEAGIDYRAQAWSANVGHYIRLVSDEVHIQRWSSSLAQVESYRLPFVSRDLERFHNYLASKEPPTQNAVVPHVVRVFRQLRNREELLNGADSLKVLLLLLACAAADTKRSQIDSSEWVVPEAAKKLAKSIDDSEWNSLIDTLKNPTASDLRLDVDLLIRHAAGPVFQEAHREAALIDSEQMPLPGFARRAADVRHVDLGVGVHFTPPPLARSVVEQVLAVAELNQPVTIFDPACGSAEFLREALRQIRLSGSKVQVKLIGWDISSTACEMARFLLAWEKKKDNASMAFEIVQCDSLEKEWPKDVDMLLMNPPFVSYERLTDEQRTSVKRVLGKLSRGRIEYSNAFIYKALDSLQKGATIGAIIPSSFYESSAAKEIREWARGHLSPSLLARLGSQVLFPDAIVDAGLLVGTVNGGDSRHLIAFWADHRSESTAEGLRYLRKTTASKRSRESTLVERDGFSIYSAPDLLDNDQSWSPRRYSAWTLTKKLSGLPRVMDLFNVHTGARSGMLKAFLLPKEQWSSLPSAERGYFRPAVVNESIENGRLNDNVYVFYPHGQLEINSENELRLRLRRFYEMHLARYRDSLRDRVSSGTKWWQMHRPRPWQQIRQSKLISVQYGDVGAFGWDSGGDFVVVGGYAWLPRSALRLTGPFPLKLGLAYLAVLNSPIFFELVASTSRKVRGGQWDLGNKYLENVPLPNLRGLTSSPIVESLFAAGSDIQSGNSVDWNALSKLVEKAYGIEG